MIDIDINGVFFESGPDLFLPHEVKYMESRRAEFFRTNKTGEVAISSHFPVGPGALGPTDADLVAFKNRPCDFQSEMIPDYLCQPEYREVEEKGDDRYWLYWPCNIKS